MSTETTVAEAWIVEQNIGGGQWRKCWFNGVCVWPLRDYAVQAATFHADLDTSPRHYRIVPLERGEPEPLEDVG